MKKGREKVGKGLGRLEWVESEIYLEEEKDFEFKALGYIGI